MSGYNVFTHVTQMPEAQKLLGALVIGGGIAWLGSRAASAIRTDAGRKAAAIPPKRFGLFSFFDVAIEAFVSYHDSILGKENRKYVPLCGTVFFFVLFANLLGLIPGVPAVTTTVWINVALALLVFLSFNYYGIKENGVVGYFKHMTAGIPVLGILVLLLELLSICLRVLTLNLRLYWNITADHMVLDIFTELVPVVVPIVFYALGTFVCFMQAFVFTTLTMIYILLATQHEEEHS